jgi:HSP20 family protein
VGILDKVTAILPWHGERREAQRPRHESTETPRSDLGLLHTGLDRWFGQLLDEPAFPRPSELGWVPLADVQESDDEVVVTVELPGLGVDDLDLMITPAGLLIRGEKREARRTTASGVSVTPEGLIVRDRPAGSRDDRRGHLYVAECRYGHFVRTVPLPPGLDFDHAEARVTNGVLTVRFPKVRSGAGARRIPILS